MWSNGGKAKTFPDWHYASRSCTCKYLRMLRLICPGRASRSCVIPGFKHTHKDTRFILQVPSGGRPGQVGVDAAQHVARGHNLGKEHARTRPCQPWITAARGRARITECVQMFLVSLSIELFVILLYLFSRYLKTSYLICVFCSEDIFNYHAHDMWNEYKRRLSITFLGSHRVSRSCVIPLCM